MFRIRDSAVVNTLYCAANKQHKLRLLRAPRCVYDDMRSECRHFAVNILNLCSVVTDVSCTYEIMLMCCLGGAGYAVSRYR